MPPDSECDGSGPSASNSLMISRIAKALGCSIEAVSDVTRDPMGAQDFTELVTIWAMMDETNRKRLLDLARAIGA